MQRIRLLIGLCLAVFCGSAAYGFSLSGSITGGQGLPLRYVFAVPVTLDTVYITIAIPFVNTYSFPNMDEGGYILFAYQDLNTNIVPDLDEPRGFYGGDIPQVFQLVSDTSGIVIELHPPNTGGFTGAVSYSGAQTGATYVMASRSPLFGGLPNGIGFLTNNTGNGAYTCFADSFGVYYAFAFMDLNSNFQRDADEPYGVYGGATPQPINVQPVNFPEDVDIVMSDVSSAGERPHPSVPDFGLQHVYPNPFNSSAMVTFRMNAPGAVDLMLFDMTGRLVRTITRDEFAAGEHRVPLSAAGLPSGIYFLRLAADNSRFDARPVYLLK